MTNRHRTRAITTALALSVAALPLAGCEPDEDQTLGGELGAGTFIYLCEAPTDAQCDENEAVAETAFRGLVVDGWFGIAYDPDADSILPASPERIAYDYALDLWQAKTPGWAAIIAMTATGAEDLAHLYVAEPAALQISQRQLTGSFSGSLGGISIEVTLQSELTLRVAPVDAEGAVLAGGLDCAWTSSDSSVAEVTSAPDDNVITVMPRGAGSTTLAVQLGQLTAETTVTVAGG